MFAIYKKELRSYFINPVGYVYVGVFLTVAALLCCYTTIISGTYNVGNYFVYMIFALIILIPLLTMRLFSEERKLRTEQLLLTAPGARCGSDCWSARSAVPDRAGVRQAALELRRGEENRTWQKNIPGRRAASERSRCFSRC